MRKYSKDRVWKNMNRREKASAYSFLLGRKLRKPALYGWLATACLLGAAAAWYAPLDPRWAIGAFIGAVGFNCIGGTLR